MNNLADKKILVTGINGQVGAALVKELVGKCELVIANRTGIGADLAIDLTDLHKIEATILKLKPDVVINPAAYTQVDQAEDEPELPFLINGEAPGVIAKACKAIDALLIHYSTDYVFNGQSETPYTEDDPTDPINVYGASKLAGEQAIQAVGGKHLIFRTCWVYDAEGKNFPNAILARAKTMETLRVVSDQIGTPTWAGFIASVTIEIVSKLLEPIEFPSSRNQIYNLMPDGKASWYDFAEALIHKHKDNVHGEQLLVKEIIPVPTTEFPTKAIRPAWSVLDNQKLKKHFHVAVASWQAYMEVAFVNTAQQFKI